MSKKKVRTKRRTKRKKTFLEKVTDFRNWNKVAFIGVSIVILIAIVSGSTYAWFTTSDSKENQFKSNFKYDVVLVDKFTPPTELKPNEPISKKVSVKNTGDITAFARILVFPVIVSSENVPLPVTEETKITYGNLNTVDWMDGKDGYFYYLKPLRPGEEAPQLFDSVDISIPEKEEYSNASFKVEIKSETIDARQNAYREAFWQADRDQPKLEEPLLIIDNKLQNPINDSKKKGE